MSCQRARNGFTLLELLASVAIIGILSAIVFAVNTNVSKRAKMINEIGAAKNVSAAYQLYSVDHDGQYMPGLDRTQKSITFRDRKISFMEAPHRYPYRLAPYLNYEFEGAIFVNGNQEQIIDKANASTGGLYDYMVSLWPALGMNMFFVGGEVYGDGSMLADQIDEVVTSHFQATEPIIAFASAGIGANPEMDLDDDILGYHLIRAPYTWDRYDWSEKLSPALFGNVAARHDGKAVCAFTDGSVQTLTIEELSDMRLWSNRAALTENPSYHPDQP